MGVFSRTNYADTSANNGAAYNLITIGGGSKLTRVEVRGAITFPGESATVSDWFNGGPLLGIQAYPASGSPLHLPSDINNNGMIVVECHVPGEIAATWAPSTDTGAVLLGGPISLTWAGQLALSPDTAIGLITGLIGSSGVTWLIAGTTTVWTT
jgi:hypothetical protein